MSLETVTFGERQLRVSDRRERRLRLPFLLRWSAGAGTYPATDGLLETSEEGNAVTAGVRGSAA